MDPWRKKGPMPVYQIRGQDVPVPEQAPPPQEGPDYEARLAEFEARVARGEKIEPTDWMPEEYRRQLIRLMHSRAWVLRLGDATEESHRRMQAALDLAWPHALGLFEPLPQEALLVEAGVKPPEAELQSRWEAEVRPILEAATLRIPTGAPVYGGRAGRHTAHLSDLLADFQKVARSGLGEAW